ncbi:MAG: hypothetical protein HY291_04910 [Planctomycetes bacterium]|nr:hypothetical protein [Planctomycetota bacterium]
MVTAMSLISLVVIGESSMIVLRRWRRFKTLGHSFNYRIVDLLGAVIGLSLTSALFFWVVYHGEHYWRDSLPFVLWFVGLMGVGQLAGSAVGRFEIDLPPLYGVLDASERAFSVFVFGIIGGFYAGMFTLFCIYVAHAFG